MVGSQLSIPSASSSVAQSSSGSAPEGLEVKRASVLPPNSWSNRIKTSAEILFGTEREVSRSERVCCRCRRGPRKSRGSLSYTETRLASDSLAYPMYLVSMDVFLQLTETTHHQQLLREGKLNEWKTSSTGSVIFVSHEWLGLSHADPDFQQVHALQRIILRLMQGDVERVETEWSTALAGFHKVSVTTDQWAAALPNMVIWFDYMSIPQLGARGTKDDIAHQVGDSGADVNTLEVADALARAVDSIPAYVERSDIILILAPVCQHRDLKDTRNFATWSRRGWCRLELWAAFLARGRTPLMLCKGMDAAPEFIEPVEAMTLQAMRGDFTCCKLNHLLNGASIECDKVKVARVLHKMVEAKTQHCLQTTELVLYRHLTSLHRWILDGYNAYSSHSDLSSFMDSLHWDVKNERSQDRVGFSLLGYAALTGELHLVRDALALGIQGIDLATPFNSTIGKYSVYTPLAAAMGYSDFAVVECILCARANPRARFCVANGGEMDAFAIAVVHGHVQNVRCWLSRFPDYDVNSRYGTNGCTAIHHGVLNCSSPRDVIEILLSAKASSSNLAAYGVPVLNMLMSSKTSCLESLELLLKNRCDPNVQITGGAASQRATLMMAGLAVRCGSRDPLLVELAAWRGMSPLMAAARDGKIEQARTLLLARADVSLTNRQGYTAFDCAHNALGHVPLPLAMLLRGRHDTMQAMSPVVSMELGHISSVVQGRPGNDSMESEASDAFLVSCSAAD